MSALAHKKLRRRRVNLAIVRGASRLPSSERQKKGYCGVH